MQLLVDDEDDDDDHDHDYDYDGQWLILTTDSYLLLNVACCSSIKLYFSCSCFFILAIFLFSLCNTATSSNINTLKGKNKEVAVYYQYMLDIIIIIRHDDHDTALAGA